MWVESMSNIKLYPLSSLSPEMFTGTSAFLIFTDYTKSIINVRKIMEVLRSKGISFTQFDKLGGHFTKDDFASAEAVCKNSKCDFIITYGTNANELVLAEKISDKLSGNSMQIISFA